MATETATRVDLPAIAALGVVSAVIAGSVVVEVHAGWQVPANIYTNVLVAPGEGKSPVLAKVGRPLAFVEQDRQDRITPLRVEAQSQLRIAEGHLKKLEKAAADAPPEERLRAQKEALHAAEEVAAIRVPAFPRLSTRDATPEALVQLIAQQGGQIAVVTDEGSEFFQMASRYSVTGEGELGDLRRRLGRQASRLGQGRTRVNRH